MNLAEYKRQAQELAEILMNFSGKEDDAEKFTKNLLEKYREFGEFNAKALECKNLAEFKNLASANGMKFESEEEANELFLGLSKGKKEVEKAILSAEEMYAVSGGNPAASRDLSILHKDDTERMLQVGADHAVAPALALQPPIQGAVALPRAHMQLGLFESLEVMAEVIRVLFAQEEMRKSLIKIVGLASAVTGAMLAIGLAFKYLE